jgi:hypothetical protein
MEANIYRKEYPAITNESNRQRTLADSLGSKNKTE